MKTCALCLNSAVLSNSHIYPAFIDRWLKETSATGYLRQIININKRVQDGNKQKLLCSNCEKEINKYETPFANTIFYPYVNNVLTPEGFVTTETNYYYEKWLLYFAISVQWRHIITSELKEENFPKGMYEIWNNYKTIWGEFLNCKRKDTGNCETHLIFLFNLFSSSGYLPENINDRINFYLMRVIDGTTVINEKKLVIYSKLGPIVIFTSILPNRLKKMSHTRIAMKGYISTRQELANTSLTQFIFVDRPNDVLSKINFSQKQQQVIINELLKNQCRVFSSNSLKILETDRILKQIKNKDYEC